MDSMTKSIRLVPNFEVVLPSRKYEMLDDMLNEHLEHVRASEIDVFGNLDEYGSYKGGIACLYMLFMMGLVNTEECTRFCSLFDDAYSEAIARHNRLKQALERRERMRGTRANRAAVI